MLLPRRRQAGGAARARTARLQLHQTAGVPGRCLQQKGCIRRRLPRALLACNAARHAAHMCAGAKQPEVGGRAGQLHRVLSAPHLLRCDKHRISAPGSSTSWQRRSGRLRPGRRCPGRHVPPLGAPPAHQDSGLQCICRGRASTTNWAGRQHCTCTCLLRLCHPTGMRLGADTAAGAARLRCSDQAVQLQGCRASTAAAASQACLACSRKP